MTQSLVIWLIGSWHLEFGILVLGFAIDMAFEIGKFSRGIGKVLSSLNSFTKQTPGYIQWLHSFFQDISIMEIIFYSFGFTLLRPRRDID